MLLGTSILVGGTLGCVLDHIIPGTPEERGLIKWSNEMSLKGSDSSSNDKSTYDFPCGMETIKGFDFIQLIIKDLINLSAFQMGLDLLLTIFAHL